MAGIPSEFIDQLLDRIDIVDIVSARVNLKKAGKDYQALCPFHTENSPSFTVSQNKQFYHCFGCGKHGSAIGFLMEFEGMDFVDSIETLSQSVGLAVPKSQYHKSNNNTANLFEITNKALMHFKSNYKNSKMAQEYMQNRQISEETLNTFQVGYALESWDSLIKQYPSTQLAEIKKAGLVAENDNHKTYDKFRNRIIFPIQDRRGRVIAFGGRAIAQDQKPKYLNSPETPIFHKGKELYGLNLARKHSNENHIIVVEGYMDVIALHDAGVKNSVATLGTATSGHHIINLLRYYESIVFCFDGDKAGIEAAWKALQVALPLYRDDKTLKFLFLPDKHDPDTYIKEHGVESFNKQLSQAQGLSQFLLEKISENIDISTIDGKAQFIDKSRIFINQLPKGQFKKLLNEEIESIAKTKINLKQQTSTRVINADVDKWTPVRKAITYLIQNPSLVKNIPPSLEITKIKQNGVNFLNEIVDFCRQSPHISTAVLLENFKDHSGYKHLTKLAMISIELTEEQVELELNDLIKFLKQLSNKTQIDNLKTKMAESGLDPDEKKHLMQLLSNQINRN